MAKTAPESMPPRPAILIRRSAPPRSGSPDSRVSFKRAGTTGVTSLDSVNQPDRSAMMSVFALDWKQMPAADTETNTAFAVTRLGLRFNAEDAGGGWSHAQTFTQPSTVASAVVTLSIIVVAPATTADGRATVTIRPGVTIPAAVPTPKRVSRIRCGLIVCAASGA